ncbi:hypothetical protein H5410_063035 [Solanum commersonii]|uniref:Uncharacterized protein n=1 Tax=Solanum commersonii TaxID=4109 RepID=A0A9J5WCM4_SOLCO|nr:hypothetical protein H5410_063035 [Solanum commersonii]
MALHLPGVNGFSTIVRCSMLYHPRGNCGCPYLLFMAIYNMLLRKQSRFRRVIRYCMSARISKILSHLNVLSRDNDIVCIDKLRVDRNVFHILASLAKNIGGVD